jgi:Retroviral aspartyl protease
MKYSENYKPPAPVAKVALRNRETLESILEVPMLLDTGSDITLLPKSFCDLINVNISDSKFAELTNFDDGKTVAFYTNIDFIFLKKRFRGNFLVFDCEEGIIGRDILNKFSILFDGINLEWNENK